MKSQRNRGLCFSVFLGLALGALSAQAQVNFWWTNTANDTWANSANWSNDLGGALAPLAGGSNDYALTFQNAGAVSTVNNLESPNFLLNQLAFDTGAGAVTIFGTNLVFTSSSTAVLPALVQNSGSLVTLNSGVQLANNLAFGGTGAGAVLLNGNLTGAGSLTMNGANYVLTLAGSNTYAGGTVVNGGVLQVTGANGLGTNSATINGGGTLFVNVAGTAPVFTNVAAIGGTGTLRISTPGTGSSGINFNENLTGFTGLLDVVASNGAGGKINMQVAAFYPSAAATVKLEKNATLFINAGGIFGSALQLYGGALGETLGQLRVEGNANVTNTITLQASSALGGNSSVGYIAGRITDNGAGYGFYKGGSGTLVLSGSNSFSGGLTNTLGATVLSNAYAMGTGVIVMNAGTLSNALNNMTITNAISMQGAGTLNTPANTTSTFSGAITNTGGLTINAGPGSSAGVIGVVQLLGSNTFTGGLAINAGIVVITNASGVGTGAKTITLTAGTAGNPTLVLKGGADGIVLPANMAFSTSWGANNGAVSNAAGNNVVNGSFTLNAGGGSTLLNVGGGTLTMNGSFTPNTTLRNLVLGGAATGTVNGVIQDGTGANILGLIKQDGGLWTITGANAYSAGTAINGGILQVGNGGTLGLNVYTNAVSISNGFQLAFNRADAYVVSNQLKGAGQVLQIGAGVLTLAGTNNSYTGKTVINNGTVWFANTGAVPVVVAGINDNVGGAVAAAGAFTNVAGWLNSGRLAVNSAGALALISNSTEAVNFGIYSNLALGAVLGNTVTYSGVYTPVANSYGAQNVNLGGGGGTLTFASLISGAANVLISGPGTVVLANTNTYSGGTTISNGVLSVGSDANLGAPGSPLALNGGTLQVQGVTLNSFILHPLGANFTGGIDVVSPFNAVVVTSNLTGSGSLTKLGKGYLILQNTNTYSGGTTVSGGTLRLLAGGGNNLLSTNGALTVLGGTLDLAGSSQATTNALSFQGGVVQGGALTAPVATLDARAGLIGADLNLTGGGPLVKTSGGLLTLLGNNTYSGGTVLSNGQLAIVSDANLGGAASAITFAGGGLTVLGSALANLNSHTVNWGALPAGTVLDIATFGNVFTVTNAIGGSSLIKDGAGTLALAGNNTFNDVLTVRAGTLNLNSDAALGVVPAAPFTNLIFNANTVLQAGGPAVTLSSNRTLLLNGGGTLTVDDAGGVFTLNGALTGAGGLTKLGTGTTVLAGTNTYAGATVVSAGTLTFAGPGTNSLGAVMVNGGVMGATLNVNASTYIYNNNIQVGTVAGDRSTLITSSNLTTFYTANSSGRLFVGNAVGASGAVIQNAGTTSVNTAQGSTDILDVGNNGGYGYYQMNGGILNAGQLGITGPGGTGNIGVFDQNGGTVTATSAGWLLFWGANATGVLNVANGSMYSPNNGNPFTLSYGGGKTFNLVNVQSNGVLNAVGNGSVVLEMMRSASTGPGDYLNINGGGLVLANRIQATSAGTTWLSFNGGTLKANTNITQLAFLQGLSNAVIYAGGATIDSANSTIGIAQNLSAPTGNGVTGVALAGGGQGYIGAPAVLISGGGGVGATGIAQVDLNPLDAQYGQVTNILITSAGSGYTSLPTVTLAGGGALTPATPGAVATNAVTGGALSKQGFGNLILSGTNTYTGGTVIKDGVLAFASPAALPASPAAGGITINASGALAMTGAFANAAAWLASGDIATNSTGALALSQASAATALNLPAAGYNSLFVGALPGTPVLFTSTLGFYNNDYRLGGGSGTLALTNDLGGNSLTIGLPGTSATNTVALNGNLSFTNGITVNGNAVLSLAGPATGTISLSNNATLQVRGTAVNGLTFNPAMAGNVTLDINHPGNSFAVPGNLTVGGTFTKAGAGTLALGGSNNVLGNVLVSAGALRLTSGDALDGLGSNVTVASGAALQLQGGIATEAGDLLTLNGGGVAASLPNGNGSLSRSGALRNMSGSNTWRGPIVLGGVSRINADAGLLTLAGPITNNNSGTISLLGGAGNMLISGAIAGSGAWGKDGAGTVAMTASNVFTGGTYIYGGTLLLDYGAAGAPQSQIIPGSSVLSMGNTYNGIQPTLSVNGPAAGTATQTFASMTLNQGYSSVIAGNNGGAVIVNLGTLTRNPGAYLDLAPPGGSGRITSNQGTNTSGVLTSYITVNGADWGALGANNAIVAFTGYTSLTGAGPVMPNGTQYVVRVDSGSTGNIDNGAGTNLIHNLSVTDPTARTLTFSGSGLLRLGGNSTGSSAGLLLAPGAGGLTVGSVPNEGLLTVGYTNNGAGELMVFNNSANALTLNSALINNGSGALTVTLGGYGTGGITLAGANNISGRTYVTSPGTTTFSGTTNTLGGLSLLGGTVNLNSPMTLTASLAADLNAVVNINAPVAITGGLTSGSTPNSRVVINMAANVTLSSGNRLQEGLGYGAATEINQTGGTFLNNGNTVVGDGTTNYAGYRITGGLLTSTGGGINIGWQSSGLVDLLGGAIVSTNGDFGIAQGATPTLAQVAVVTVNGGFLGIVGSSGNLLMNKTANAKTFAQLSVLSGGVDVTAGMNNRVIDLMNTAGNTGIVNLVGGVVTANQFKASAAGLSVLNLNGGSIVVSPTSSLAGTFLQGLSAAYVYGGGVNINTDTNSVTILQNLAGATGFGLSSIALATNGAGYIGAPAVLIAGGSGTGATAVAQFDPVAQQVTNILITSAGVGYLPTDALSLQMVGGGYTSEAVLGAINFAANVNNGGLTKNGTGTLTLTGTNSYGGLTMVNAGTLVFQPAATATNTLGGLGGSGTVLHNGTGLTILNGDSSTFTGSAAINTGTVQFASLSAVPVNTNVLANAGGVAAFDFGAGNVQTALTRLNTNSAGTVALTPNSINENVDFSGAGAQLANAFLGVMGSQTYGGLYTPYNNRYQLSAVNGGVFTFTNALGGASALTVGTGAGASAGTVALTQPVNTTGRLTVNAGSTLNVLGNNVVAGSLAGGAGVILNSSNAAVLTVGSDNTSTTFGGGINGALGLTKVGAGMLTLTNASTYNGPTLVSAGTLQLAPTTNQAGLMEGWAVGAAVWQPSALTNMPTGVQLSLRFANVSLPGGATSPKPPVWDGTTWPQVTTIGYSGYVYNNGSTNVTWTVAMNCDDASKLYIDGVNVLSTSGNGTLQTNLVLTPGAHTIEVRLGNNTSNGGANYAAYGSGSCFIIDPLGRGTTSAANYIIPVETGNGTLFTSGLNILPAQTTVQIASGATLDLNGAQQLIAGLSDPFTAPGLGGLVTNSQAALASVLTLNPQSGSNYLFSGNISDAGAANAIGLIVNGPGLQTFAGTNTYSGGTLINSGGILQINNTSAVSRTGWVTVGSNGTLAAGNSVAISDLLRIGRITNSSAGSVALTQNSSEAVDFTLGGGYAGLYLGAVSNVAYSGTITPVGGLYRLGGGGGMLTIVNPLTAGSVAIGGGAGTVLLTNVLNTYTGTVINAGTLSVGADGALGNSIAGATNLTFTGNGNLQAGAAGVTLGANRTILVTNGVLGTLDNNGYNFTVNGNILGGGTLVSVGAGTNTLGGLTNTVLGIMARSGTLAFAPGSSNNISGMNNSTSFGLQVAPVTGDRAIVRFNPAAGLTNVVLGSLRVGNGTNSAGAIYQAGGVVLVNGASGNQDAAIGSGAGYGYYNITGGTLIASQMEVSAVNTGAGGVGVMDILGGTVSPQNYFIIGRSANGIGVVNVANGGVLQSSPNNTGIAFGWDANANGYGVLNILNGGYLNASIGSKTVDLGASAAGNTGILNLNGGGTAMVYQITRSQIGTGLLNFNGGLLIASASASSTLINNNLTAAYVYPGGLNLSNSVNSAILQPLLAPTGYGVTGIALVNGGTNYIGAPALMISGGSGLGATAIAQINAAGVITNILITNYGVGYQPTDVLTVQLLGGGATVAGTLGTVTFGANSGSGGLVKTGPGELTLGGNNTYGGATIINAGNLLLGGGGATGSLLNPNVTFASNSSWLGFNRSDVVTNGINVTVTPGGNFAAVVQAGGGTLVLTNTALNFNQVAVSNGLVWFGSAAAMPTNTNGRNSIILATGGGVLASNLFGSVNGWLNSGMLTNNAGGGLLALSTGVNTENVNWVAGNGVVYSNMYLGAAPGNVATFLGTLTPVGTNYLVGGGGGTLVVGNDYAFADPNMLTNRSVTFGTTGSNGAVVVLGPQNYTGGTTINNTLVSISADNNLGYGGLSLLNGGTLQITNSPNNSFATIKPVAVTGTSTLDIGGAVTGIFYGAISGAGTVNKNGSGTLALAGAFNAAAAGGNINNVNGGTLWLMGGSSLNNNNGNSDLYLNNGTAMQVDSNASVYVQTLRVGNSGTSNVNYNQSGGIVTTKQWFVIGQNAGNTGTVNLTGGSLVYDAANGAYHLSVGENGMGTLNVSNATITGLGTAAANGILYVAHNNGATGTVNQFAGSVVNLSGTGGGVTLGGATNTFSTYNLGAGGLLTTPRVIGGWTGGGTYRSQFYFNGGTLQADANNASFMQNITTVGVAAAGAFLDSSIFNITVSNNIAGTGALTKLGVGTLVLAGNNGYSGGSVVNAGTLWFANTNLSWSNAAANVTINSGGIVAAAGSMSASPYTNVTSWLASGRITTNSTGAIGMISNNNESITLGVYSNLSLAAVSGSNVQYTGTLTPANNFYRLAAGAGGTLQMINTNALTGGLGLLVSGPGTVTLAASNNFTGGTLINSGATLLLANNAGAGTLTAMVTNNGTLAAGYALDQTTLTRMTTLSTGVVALAANSGNSLDFSAAGANLPAVSLGAVAGGSWTNSGALAPYGATYQLGGGGGTLVFTNSALNGPGTNLVAFGGGASGSLVLTGTNTFDGGTLLGPLGTATVATVSLGSGNVTNNGALVLNNAGAAGTLANNISGSGSLLLTGATSNAWMVTLSGNNTYTGLTVVAANNYLILSNTTGNAALQGNVQIGNVSGNNSFLRMGYGVGQQFGSNTVISFVGNGATILGRMDMLGTTQTVAGLNDPLASGLVENSGNSLTDMYAADTNAGPGQLVISNTANYVFSGYMRNAGGVAAPNSRLSLVKDGLGQQTLIGGNITYTGPTIVQNGVLALSNTTSFASPVTVNGGQLLLATPGNSTVMNQMVTNNAYNGLAFANGTAFSIGGLAGSGSITLWSQTGGGVTLTLGGNNSNTTYSGTLTDEGPGNFYQGNLVKNGSGILTLTGTNTYNGYNLINAGTLQADVGAGLSPYANTTINGGSLASVAGLITDAVGLGANQVNILNGGFSALGTPTLVSLGGVGTPATLTWGTLGFTPSIFVLNDTNANNLLTLANNLNLNGTNVAVGVNATNLGAVATISGVISDSVGTGTLVKRGIGTLALAGANTYTGGTYIAAGNLAVTNDLLGAAGAPLYLTNNGALQASGSFTLNNRAVTVQTGGGKFNVDPGVTLTITNNMLATGGALTKTGAGTLAFGGIGMLTNGVNITRGGIVMTNGTVFQGGSTVNIGQNSGDFGTLALAGNAIWAGSVANSPMYLGAVAGSTGIVTVADSALLSNRLFVGYSGVGALYQRGGTVVDLGASANDNGVGYNAGSYGYYELANGLFSNGVFGGVSYGGVGVMAQYGGTQVVWNGGTFEIARNNGTGVVYLAGGLLKSLQTMEFGHSSGNGNGMGVITVAGGLLTVGTINTPAYSNQNDFINLNGGVLQANSISKGSPTSNTLFALNFNGGVLRAGAAGNLIGTGANALDGAYIYANGATIDSSNFNVSIAQGLSAPAGSGVVGVAFSPLGGYLGSPYVSISGGGGTGATAYAQFDSVAGLVTGIVMTSYGYGYTSSPTVTLVGGGSTNFVVSGVTLANNTSGGLTVTGGSNGVLNLSGVNTYGGGTTINGGNLLFTSATALPATGQVLINYGGSLGVTNASSPFTNISSWLASGSLSNLSAGTLSLANNSPASETDDLNATGYGLLTLGAVSGMTVTNNANIVPNSLTYRLGGGWGTLVITNNLGLGNALVAFGGGSGGTLILGGSNYFPSGVTINPLGVVQANSPYALGGLTGIVVPYGATLADGVPMDNTFLGTISGISSGTLALAVSTSNPLDFNAAALPTVSLGAVGTVTNDSSLITPNAGVYRLGGGGGTLVLTNNGLIGAGASLVAFGGGTGGNLVLSGTNTYDSGTWIGPLGTATVSTVSLGTGPVTNNGVLAFAQSLAGTNNNAISGTGSLSLSSAVLIGLAGSNTFSGGLTVAISNTILQVNNPSPLGTGGIVLTNGGVLQIASGNNTYTNALVLYTGDLQAAYNGALRNSGGTNIWAGPITLLNGTSIGASAGILRITGGIYGSGGNLRPSGSGLLQVDTTPISIGGGGMGLQGGNFYLAVGGNTFNTMTIYSGNVLLGVSNALPATATLSFAVNNSSGSSVVLSNYNQTIAGISFAPSAAMALTSNLINVGTATLTVNGAMTVGSAGSNTTTRLTVTGPGALLVNNNGGTMQYGLNTTTGGNYVTNDMSALGTFAANLGATGKLIVGDQSSDQTSQGSSLVKLATNNTITANILSLGDGTGHTATETLLLGAGQNTLNVNTVNIGSVNGVGGANGVLQFNGATGSMTLSNATGGRAELDVAGLVNATGFLITGLVNLTSHPSSLYLNNLNMADLNAGLSQYNGPRTASFLFDTGTLDVSNITMSLRNSGATNMTASSTATLNIGGGTANIGQILMATNDLNFSKGNATVNLTGGTVTISNGVSRGLGGTGSAVINLAGSALNMNGSAIGAAGGVNYQIALNASNGTLQNLAELNGGATPLVKVGPGTLTMLGNNTYSGGTLISGGTLQLGDGAVNNGSVSGNISNNANLVFANPLNQTYTGTVSGAGALTKSAAGVLTLTAANTYLGNTTINNGTLRLGLNNALPPTAVSGGAAGNLDLGGFNQLLTGVDGYLGVVTNSGLASTLTVNLTTTQNFGGTLAGPANFTVQGGGRLYVSGSSSPSYTGNVSVSNATVLVQGTLTTGGLIQVYNGGTLGGTGALGNVKVNSGGSYSPGFSPGTQLVVSLTLTGGLFNENIVSAANYSRVVAAHGFNLLPGTTNYLHLALSSYVFENGASYLMVEDDSATAWNGNQFVLSDALSPDNGATLVNGGTFLAVGEGSSTNMFRIVYNYDSVSGTTGTGNDILLTVIPEPTTVNLLVLIGAAAGLRRLLRKRRRLQS